MVAQHPCNCGSGLQLPSSTTCSLLHHCYYPRRGTIIVAISIASVTIMLVTRIIIAIVITITSCRSVGIGIRSGVVAIFVVLVIGDVVAL